MPVRKCGAELIEHNNGLLRQQFLNSVPLGQITDGQVQWADSRINRRPRKRFGFKTPIHGLQYAFESDEIAV